MTDNEIHGIAADAAHPGEPMQDEPLWKALLGWPVILKRMRTGRPDSPAAGAEDAARAALEQGTPRQDLPMSAQLAYDRLADPGAANGR